MYVSNVPYVQNIKLARLTKVVIEKEYMCTYVHMVPFAQYSLEERNLYWFGLKQNLFFPEDYDDCPLARTGTGTVRTVRK